MTVKEYEAETTKMEFEAMMNMNPKQTENFLDQLQERIAMISADIPESPDPHLIPIQESLVGCLSDIRNAWIHRAALECTLDQRSFNGFSEAYYQNRDQ